MPLTDDEYTCLLIMKDGENLIRMRDTRWYAPLGSLHERGLVKPIGNENYIISQLGLAAAVEHERGLDSALDTTIRKHIEVNNTRVHMLDHMRSAVESLRCAAECASRATGQSKKDALRNIAHEVLERALEKIA